MKTRNIYYKLRILVLERLYNHTLTNGFFTKVKNLFSMPNILYNFVLIM